MQKIFKFRLSALKLFIIYGTVIFHKKCIGKYEKINTLFRKLKPSIKIIKNKKYRKNIFFFIETQNLFNLISSSKF